MTNDLNESTSQSTSTNLPRRPTWDAVWMRMSDILAQRSRCDRAKVGCILVDEKKNILAATYNGPPPGYEVEGTCRSWCPRAMGIGEVSNDYSNCPSSHAEINAVARMRPADGAITAYVNRMCCSSCAKALAAAGVSRVVCLVTDIDGHLNGEKTEEFLIQCGVQFDYLFLGEISE